VIAAVRSRVGERVGASVAAAVLVGALALTGAPLALAVFSTLKTGGPMTLITGTLAAPGTPRAAQTNCRTNKSPEIKLEWAASSSEWASTYEIERRTGSSGSYEAVASVASTQTSYTDKSNALEYSTTYNYRVSAVYHSWSAPSGATSVKTLSRFCV